MSDDRDTDQSPDAVFTAEGMRQLEAGNVEGSNALFRVAQQIQRDADKEEKEKRQ